MQDKDIDALAGCLAFLVKAVLIIWLWVELDSLIPEKYDTALSLLMILLLI